MKLKPIRAAFALALFSTVACHSTTYWAVTTPTEQTNKSDSCYNLCQSKHDDSSAYLECLRGCPGNAVYDGQQCSDVQAPPNTFCSEGTGKKFSVGKTIGLIAGVTVAVVLIAIGATAGAAVSASGQTAPNQ